MDRNCILQSKATRRLKNQLCSMCENRKELITTHQIKASEWQNMNKLLTWLRTTSVDLHYFVHRLDVALYDGNFSLHYFTGHSKHKAFPNTQNVASVSRFTLVDCSQICSGVVPITHHLFASDFHRMR